MEETRILPAWQVAILLVSASYGIGFLFGSGEAALQWGMAGSIYAMVTALGIALLAIAASRLWRSRMQIWQLLGAAYGERVSKLAAVLSIVWMSGVLAAQVHGGVAVVRLMGLPTLPAYGLMLSLIFIASRLDLMLAAKLFALCLAASGLLLLYALLSVAGVPVLLDAVPSFVDDLQRVPTTRLWVVVLAIAPLVLTGADYQQFVLTARSSRAATLGCVMAAAFLLMFGLLPAAVVVAYERGVNVAQPTIGHQIMPFIMAGVAKRLMAGYDWIVLLGLLSAALGSAAAIVRAMSSAALSVSKFKIAPSLASCLMVSLGGVIASRGQAIIDTMVALNMVYLGAICVVFLALIIRWKVSPQSAWFAMLAGFSASSTAYMFGWFGLASIDSDLLSLAAGVLASLAACVGHLCFNRFRLTGQASLAREP